MKQPKVLGVIPARLDSTRLPEKMLANISGQPLICWTHQQASRASLLDDLIVATDAKTILEAVKKCNGQAILTSDKPNSGTERVAELVQRLHQMKPEVVVNIQGDEPLISPAAIDAVASILIEDRRLVMSTAATPFVHKKDIDNPNNVKVVIDSQNFALYFSRAVIPYPRQKRQVYLRHLGLYAFRKKFLAEFVKLSPRPLEQSENLEQLRTLEYGHKIKVIIGNFDSVSVDTKEDLRLARKLIKQRFRQRENVRIPPW